MMDPVSQITSYLQRMRDGDPAAAAAMLPLLYDELRGIAGRLLRSTPAHTLQATALVHEAWLKIAKANGGQPQFADRVHFLAVAAKAMRQILLNHARDRRAQKRGGGAQRVPLDEFLDVVEAETGDVVALDELLQQLAAANPRHAQVVELRVFGGMSIEEVAAALGTGLTTVKADWRFARAFLVSQLRPDADD
jgi:RNA polymerase sigma factor (TIGR02999 family)